MKIKSILIAGILAVVLLAGVGCEYIPGFAQTPSPTPTLPSTPINPTFTPPSPGTTSIPLPDIADVVDKVRPSVVAITTEYTNIFNQRDEGAGSGWILNGSGLIVTNYHVIEGANKVTVTLDNGATYDARSIRGDQISDLAVIDIGIAGLPAAIIGDSTRLRLGEWLVVIGNALGEGISVKEGVLSRTGVSIQVSAEETLYNLIETSAAINPGNSGGPLVNMTGEVIGITNAKLAAVEVESVGFAIPTNIAMPLISELIQKGYITRPWLGVSLDNVNQFRVLRYGLGTSTGAFILEVNPQSPADTAGLRNNDVVVSFNGKEIKSAFELVEAIRSSQIGQAVEIGFYRGRELRTTTVTLQESPPP